MCKRICAIITEAQVEFVPECPLLAGPSRSSLNVFIFCFEFTSGGRGQDGSPIIIFPEFPSFGEISDEEFHNVLTYLTSVPRYRHSFTWELFKWFCLSLIYKIKVLVYIPCCSCWHTHVREKKLTIFLVEDCRLFLLAECFNHLYFSFGSLISTITSNPETEMAISTHSTLIILNDPSKAKS